VRRQPAEGGPWGGLAPDGPDWTANYHSGFRGSKGERGGTLQRVVGFDGVRDVQSQVLELRA
jgi:hypothetical protein